MNIDSSNKLFWYAVYVKSRHEFRVQELMTKAQIETFLPTVEMVRRWKDRKKLVTFPLFPGYIFVHIPDSKASVLTVLKIYGVVNVLGDKIGKHTPIPEVQIASLKFFVENKADIEPYPYLKEGQKVRIKSGYLAGAEGILVKRKGHHMLVLSIDILQQGASVKIDASDVEPV